MSWSEIALSVVLAVLIVSGLNALRERPWRRLYRHRIVVNIDDGDAFSGVLLSQQGPLLILADATHHDPATGRRLELDGEVVIERDRVRFVQVLAA